MLVTRTNRTPVGQALLLAIALIVGVVVYSASNSGSRPDPAGSQSGTLATSAPSEVATTGAPATPGTTATVAVTEPPVEDYPPGQPFLPGIILTEEEVEGWEEESAGDYICPNGEECGWGETTLP